jgi:16S rRNA (adenine1518-N6/adenine1519-N6)-dimethyltransferase
MPTLGRRRALGQHFLKDNSVVLEIVETAIAEASVHHCRGMLEIGPGRGALTLPLIQALRTSQIEHLQLVERDPKFATHWQTHESPFQPFAVEESDFLDLPKEKWLLKSPLIVVSNLPYSAGTAILDRLARQTAEIPVMVLMFQAEVARRLYAPPSTKSRGSLSVWIQNRWDVKSLLLVPPKAFSPAPDVDSEVVVLTRRPTPWVDFPNDSEHEKLWESFLKACFAQRRKMLRSVVPWRNALELSGVDGTKRAEALEWQEWNSLFQAVRKVSGLPST